MSNTKKKPSDYVTLGEGFNDITLSRPATIDGAKVSSLRMREVIVADQERYQEGTGNDASREVVLFANLCEVTPDDIRKLPLRDYQRLQASYGLFTD